MKHVNGYLELLRLRSNETYEHSLRVAELSLKLGRINGLESSDVDTLYKAGLLHDIGKIEVPDGILAKNGSLSEEERMVINEHVRKGSYILQNEGLEEVKKVMLMHHEFSPNPYPRNGERRDGHRNNGSDRRRQVDFRTYSLAQMLAVSDTCDALVSPRAYKPALSKDEVKAGLEKGFKGERKYIDQVLSLV